MSRGLKYFFIAYVIGLAGYVTYTNLAKRQWGRLQVGFKEPVKICYDEGHRWSYCVYTGDRSHKKVILYALHGKDEDASFWARKTGYPALLQKYWQDYDKKYPTVVTVSFGPVWLLTEKGSAKDSGLIDSFFSEVIPGIEEKLGRPRQRFIMGVSMGGLNSLVAAFAQPKMFNRIVSLCPPVYEMSPYSGWRKMMSFAYQTGAQPQSLFTAMALGRYYFASTQEWLNFSPLEQVRAVRFKPRQHIYISAGLRDEFGLFKGVQRLVHHLENSGGIVHWKPFSGKHCSVDIESLGRFLSL